jgi:serine/threonine protein kinase
MQIANEIRLLAHLKHPNIIQFVNNFVDNGVVHIVMVCEPAGMNIGMCPSYKSVCRSTPLEEL